MFFILFSFNLSVFGALFTVPTEKKEILETRYVQATRVGVDFFKVDQSFLLEDLNLSSSSLLVETIPISLNSQISFRATLLWYYSPKIYVETSWEGTRNLTSYLDDLRTFELNLRHSQSMFDDCSIEQIFPQKREEAAFKRGEILLHLQRDSKIDVSFGMEWFFFAFFQDRKVRLSSGSQIVDSFGSFSGPLDPLVPEVPGWNSSDLEALYTHLRSSSLFLGFGPKCLFKQEIPFDNGFKLMGQLAASFLGGTQRRKGSSQPFFLERDSFFSTSAPFSQGGESFFVGIESTVGIEWRRQKEKGRELGLGLILRNSFYSSGLFTPGDHLFDFGRSGVFAEISISF